MITGCNRLQWAATPRHRLALGQFLNYRLVNPMFENTLDLGLVKNVFLPLPRSPSSLA
ncbi:hypothetical protein VB735_34565 [Halotia wernerae UHCC 0503]|nr:hypothetical protein [Halotia wernerae UHCC 0503]